MATLASETVAVAPAKMAGGGAPLEQADAAAIRAMIESHGAV